MAESNTKIVRLVAILAAVGLAAMATAVGVASWTHTSVQDARARVSEQEGKISQAASTALKRLNVARSTAGQLLDATADASEAAAANRTATENLENSLASIHDLSVSHGLNDGSIVNRAAEFWRQTSADCRSWFERYCSNRAERADAYNRVISTYREMNSLVLAAIGELRLQRTREIGSGPSQSMPADALLGRLAEANKAMAELRAAEDELSDLALIVERLTSSTSSSQLADLRDNQIKPAISRLRECLPRIGRYRKDVAERANGAFTRFSDALLGSDYLVDETHQTIVPGHGGFLVAVESSVELLQAREKLRASITGAAEGVNRSIVALESSSGRSAAKMTLEAEKAAAAAWRTTIIVSGVCAASFLMLAWRIARSVRIQVGMLEESHSALDASRQQYRVLLETTRAVPWQAGESMNEFTYVGPQGGELLGCAPEDWLRPGFWTERVHEEDRAHVEELMHAARSARTHCEAEFRMLHSDAHWIWVRAIASGAADESGKVTLRGLLFDVTEKRKLELELRQAQKLESVGRLAAGVAHEINTPIQFVSDSVHFVRDSVSELGGLLSKLQSVAHRVIDGKPAGDDARDAVSAEEASDLPYLMENLPKALDRALEGLGRVTTIVRSMKEFAHPDQAEMEAIDLNRAIESTLVIARNEYKYVADLETDLQSLPAVTCFVGDVNQVVLNLVVNAAHAIGDVEKKRNGRGRIRVTSRVDDGYAVVSVEDTGGGIPEPIRERIFEPFFTTKEVGMGTGQGLAIAKTIIENKHGGKLTFESEIGRGTTFRFRIPIDGVASKAAGAAA